MYHVLILLHSKLRILRIESEQIMEIWGVTIKEEEIELNMHDGNGSNGDWLYANNHCNCFHEIADKRSRNGRGAKCNPNLRRGARPADFEVILPGDRVNEPI
jgi:hypothetical protein